MSSQPGALAARARSPRSSARPPARSWACSSRAPGELRGLAGQVRRRAVEALSAGRPTTPLSRRPSAMRRASMATSAGSTAPSRVAVSSAACAEAKGRRGCKSSTSTSARAPSRSPSLRRAHCQERSCVAVKRPPERACASALAQGSAPGLRVIGGLRDLRGQTTHHAGALAQRRALLAPRLWRGRLRALQSGIAGACVCESS